MERIVEFYREKGAGRVGFFLMALLLHLILFLLVATWVIFQAPKPEPEAEFGRVESIPVKLPPPPEPPASGDAAANPHFEPQPVVVPVTTPTHTITTANFNFSVDTSKVIDQAMSHINLPQATGAGLTQGAGNASSGSGMSSVFGSSSGSNTELIGYLYDLKQTPDRKPTDNMEDAAGSRNVMNFLRSFVKDWNMSSLDQYYKSPAPLYATQIFIPERHSEDSTKAFGVDSVVAAKRWIIVYNGKVIPPESGTFRFVGWADDFLLVRWDGANVLDASYPSEEVDPSANSEDAGGKDGDQTDKYGKWIQMEAGVPVPIQVLIGEGPGGYSGFRLLIQKQGDDSQGGDYPVFQLQDGPIPDLGKDIKFSKKKMLFQGAPQ
jgi:hypothetical protein